MVIAAISPNILAGKIRASALPYVDNVGEGRFLRLQQILAIVMITDIYLRVKLALPEQQKKLTAAQNEHSQLGFFIIEQALQIIQCLMMMNCYKNGGIDIRVFKRRVRARF